MDLTRLALIGEISQSFAVGLAAIAAGAWALYRYRLERSLEPTLTISVSAVPVVRSPGISVVPVRLELKNCGRGVISCKGRKEGIPVWSDSLETLYFPLNLQIRRLVPPQPTRAAAYDWFDEAVTCVVQGLPKEINLLRPYEAPGSGETGFFLEPGESSVVEFVVTLPAGDYLVKGTFIGDAGPNAFWTDIRYVGVPETLQEDSGARP